MLLFLIPVIILAGATSLGIAAEISQSQSPAAEPAERAAEKAPPRHQERLDR